MVTLGQVWYGENTLCGIWIPRAFRRLWIGKGIEQRPKIHFSTSLGFSPKNISVGSLLEASIPEIKEKSSKFPHESLSCKYWVTARNGLKAG